MAASDLYSQALSILTDARSTMLSSAWQASLDNASQDVRVAAGNSLIQLQGAILALSNASLRDIATAMQANETSLTQASTALSDALKDITKVQNAMTTVNNIVKVVAQIVPLL
jgi:hypothetical protein